MQAVEVADVDSRAVEVADAEASVAVEVVDAEVVEVAVDGEVVEVAADVVAAVDIANRQVPSQISSERPAPTSAGLFP